MAFFLRVSGRIDPTLDGQDFGSDLLDGLVGDRYNRPAIPGKEALGVIQLFFHVFK